MGSAITKRATEDGGRIVVISSPKDAHIPYVQKHLSEQMVIINPRDLANGKLLTYRNYGKKVSVTYGGQDLSNVKSVWVRKPEEVDQDALPIVPEFRQYAADALRQLAGLLYSAFQDALWVSDSYAMVKANSKVWEVEIAEKLGFNVPEMIITSDKAAVEALAGRYETIIMKALVHMNSDVDGVNKVFFARKLTKSTLPSLTSLHISPMIFQQAIVDPLSDIRVTVIGDKVFAARITVENQASEEVRDWRVGHFEGDMKITAFEDFPEDIARLCVEHTRALGLNFGAIDLVEAKDGTIWFLENNPSGQWAFVERYTGQSIGKAMASFLAAGKQ